MTDKNHSTKAPNNIKYDSERAMRRAYRWQPPIWGSASCFRHAERALASPPVHNYLNRKSAQMAIRGYKDAADPLVHS
jgi:hypothetical protein